MSAVACQPGGGLVASAGSGIVKLWDMATGMFVRELPGHAHYWQTLSFSADGSLLASGGDDWIIAYGTSNPPPDARDSGLSFWGDWPHHAASDHTVELLSARLLDPLLTQKDDDEVDRLLAPLADADARVRVQAAQRLEAAGAWPAMTTTDVSKEPASPATIQNLRQVLGDRYRERRDERVYYVLRQIGSLRARWLLHRIADALRYLILFRDASHQTATRRTPIRRRPSAVNLITVPRNAAARPNDRPIACLR